MRAQEILGLTGEIHDRLFGPRPQQETGLPVPPAPDGAFVEMQGRYLEQALHALEATYADLRSIAGELGIVADKETRPVGRAIGR